MLHRIDVAILHIADVIRLVPDQMLPRSGLPDAALTTSLPHLAQALTLAHRDDGWASVNAGPRAAQYASLLRPTVLLVLAEHGLEPTPTFGRPASVRRGSSTMKD